MNNWVIRKFPKDSIFEDCELIENIKVDAILTTYKLNVNDDYILLDERDRMAFAYIDFDFDNFEYFLEQE